MDKTLIQNIIAVTNKAIDTTSVKYTVETKDLSFNVYNDCYVLNIDITHVHIDSNRGQISIELDNIIGIQFMDKRAVVGMK